MSGTETRQVLTVYADYVCPFCYLGKASLEAYLDGASEPVDVEWHPYDLRGHARGQDGRLREGVQDGKTEAYYESAAANVERLKARYGVEMSLDLAREVDSWRAQQAALYVRREYDDAGFRRFHDAVFEALWVDGHDIGDLDVLYGLAESVGLPADDLLEALDGGAMEPDLRELVEAARERGVTAVPTFVFGERAALGAVPPAHLQELVEGDRSTPA